MSETLQIATEKEYTTSYGSVPALFFVASEAKDQHHVNEPLTREEFMAYLETASGTLDELPELTEEGHPELFKMVEDATKEYKAGECEEF